MDTSDLAKRMKNYEQVKESKLIKRIPVAIRVDGRAFHTFTRGFQKPFDPILMQAMQETMMYLCKNIQGCVLGYTQSDEITLILLDYQNLDSDIWFDGKVQKISSITASMATLAFNQNFSRIATNYINIYDKPFIGEYTKHYLTILNNAINKSAMFDARCFNIPKEEVTNLIYWRQLDAIRNSIQMVGHANFSHKELQNKSCREIKDMLYEMGVTWDNFPVYKKRGSCCIKITPKNQERVLLIRGITPIMRPQWTIDNNIPIFKDEGREYIEKLVDI
jgi:tRNA(His) 5'-end guanylyltransferase